MRSIVVFGSLNYDILFEVDRLPTVGETRAARSVSFQGGGKGANQAVQAALLGVPVEMVGAVGTDALGSDLLGRLERAGVGTSHVHRLDEATGVGVVSFLDDGAVSATIGRGANFALTEEHVTAAATLFSKATVAVFQLENPVTLVARAAGIARDEGCTVILNAAPACEIPDSLVDATDVLVVNEVEAAYYLGRDDPVGLAYAEDAARELQTRFHAAVIVTMGPDGSFLVDNHGAGAHIPAIPVRAIETTGAGDSYVGAMAVALARGESLNDAATYGTLASSITIQGIGAQGAMPDATMMSR